MIDKPEILFVVLSTIIVELLIGLAISLVVTFAKGVRFYGRKSSK